MTNFDLCVLGGGPGGLSAAIRGAKRGARVCLIDPGPLGGTCLNQGCIPARALGTTAKLMAQIAKAKALGIQIEGKVSIDLASVVARKERILHRLRSALVALLDRSKVSWIQGVGVLQGPQEVEILPGEGRGQGVKAKAIILATGSRPSSLSSCPIDGKTILTSDELLDLTVLPASLIVVGAGVIGCEFASYFCDLGVKVILVEAEKQILPFEDDGIAQAFHQSLKRRGVTIFTGVKVSQVQKKEGGASIVFSDGKTVTAEKVLVATGRDPQLPKGAEAVGLKIEKKSLPVDEGLRTKTRSIFAIGDLLGEYQLACTASYEGAIAAENALGGEKRPEYTVVPEVIFTEPEIATVGLTQKEAQEAGHRMGSSRLTLTGFARAQTFEEMEGFVQVVADRSTRKILGVQIIGPRATDLIGEAALAIKQGLSLQDLADTLHGHPTMSESLWETTAMALGQSIYYASAESL